MVGRSSRKNKRCQVGFAARILHKVAALKPVPGGDGEANPGRTSEKDAHRVARKLRRSCRDSRVPSLCVHSPFQRQVKLREGKEVTFPRI